MPWSKASSASAPTTSVRHAAAVPSSDTVRRAALNASWARDRRLARRRLAFRWLFWAWWHIGLPMLLALALAVWLLGQLPPAKVPAWLKPIVSLGHFTVPNSSEKPPAAAYPPFKNALHGKEP